MNLNTIYSFLLILSVMASCNAQEPRIKFSTFDNKGCSITIPVDKGYKEFLKEKDGFLQISKSEFKDSTYMLYLPQSDLPSIVITFGVVNLSRTPTPLDFSKSIIKYQQKSIMKIDSIDYKDFDIDNVGKLNKVSYKFTDNGIHAVHYSFFHNDKVFTVAYNFVNDKSPKDPDEQIEQLELVCP